MSIKVTVILDLPEQAEAEVAARLRRMREWTEDVSLATPSGMFPARLYEIHCDGEDPGRC